MRSRCGDPMHTPRLRGADGRSRSRSSRRRPRRDSRRRSPAGSLPLAPHDYGEVSASQTALSTPVCQFGKRACQTLRSRRMLATVSDIAGVSDIFGQEFWDDRYRSRPALWSGAVNPQLSEQAADLPPGRALDVGSGEGADAIWLAERGWRVTAMDIFTVALQRGAERAAAVGAEVARR